MLDERNEVVGRSEVHLPISCWIYILILRTLPGSTAPEQSCSTPMVVPTTLRRLPGMTRKGHPGTCCLYTLFNPFERADEWVESASGTLSNVGRVLACWFFVGCPRLSLSWKCNGEAPPPTPNFQSHVVWSSGDRAGWSPQHGGFRLLHARGAMYHSRWCLPCSCTRAVLASVCLEGNVGEENHCPKQA